MLIQARLISMMKAIWTLSFNAGTSSYDMKDARSMKHET